jgi:ADP-ribose pyrophosphatase YjhB (NUDIX family)
MIQSAVRERQKVVLYVTSRKHLLVFREPRFPEVGLQPPGGTMADGETVERACCRELFEESGIEAPESSFFVVGKRTYEYEAASMLHRHHRTFCHARIDEPIDRIWQHVEEFPDGGDAPLLFELFWLPLESEIPLFAELGVFLPAVRDRLGIAA